MSVVASMSAAATRILEALTRCSPDVWADLRKGRGLAIPDSYPEWLDCL